MTTSQFFSTFVPLLLASAAAGYIWPNPKLDTLENLRWDQNGIGGGNLGGFSLPCNQFAFDLDGTNSNRTNAADWLRTAYHDMATYDIKTGTGGLDASIQFDDEQQRPENAGNSFSNSIKVFKVITNRYISMADMIAVGAIFAVEQCGGPKIDFRAGRIDAEKAGPTGVPEPQDTLESHTDAFARMGFTATEMIQLIACGHTIGGVQSKFFPQIVPNNTQTDDNGDGNAPFDSSSFEFDNHIATDYISGRTANPLVVGANVTTRSDLRIFSSDNNVTMQAFADSPSLFMSTCATLLSRMLNTVPRDVVLTDVIEPLPAKPHNLMLMHLNNGSMALTGSVRFWNLNADGSAQVKLVWADDSGNQCPGCTATLAHGRIFTGKWLPENHTSVWYNFPSNGALIDSSAGISKFWFEVEENGKQWVEDQDGQGFPLQTKVLVADTSCFTSDFTSLHVDIAVRKSLKPARVFLVGDKFDEDGVPVPLQASFFDATFNEEASSKDLTHNIYSVNVSLTFSTFNVGATIDGQNVTDWTSVSEESLENMGFSSCH